MIEPPDTQPPGKWVLKLKETSGTVRGVDFADFVKKVNDQLSANGREPISAEAVLERMKPC